MTAQAFPPSATMTDEAIIVENIDLNAQRTVPANHIQWRFWEISPITKFKDRHASEHALLRKSNQRRTRTNLLARLRELLFSEVATRCNKRKKKISFIAIAHLLINQNPNPSIIFIHKNKQLPCVAKNYYRRNWRRLPSTVDFFSFVAQKTMYRPYHQSFIKSSSCLSRYCTLEMT